MRKSSKLLAVLLTLCLLFGAITAIFASASETLKVTDYSCNVGDADAAQLFESENTGRWLGLNSEKVELADNTYIRVNCNPTASHSTEKFYGYAGYGSYQITQSYVASRPTNDSGEYTSDYAEADLSNFDYFTVDFDFGTDAYAYTFEKDGVTYYGTGTTVDEAVARIAETQSVTVTAEDVVGEPTLAFPDNEGTGFHLVFNSSIDGKEDTAIKSTGSGSSSANNTTGWKQGTPSPSIYVFEKDGAWYVGGTTGDTTTAAKLKGEVGAFDHVQLAFEVTSTTTTSDGVTTTTLEATEHLFVNGKYVASLGSWTSTSKYNMLYRLLIRTHKVKSSSGASASDPTTWCDKMFDTYSLAIDNIAVNYYNEENDPETASVKENITKVTARYSETHDFSEESESVTTKNSAGELEYSTLTNKTGIGQANATMSRYMLVTHKTLNGNTYARVHYNSEALSNPTGVDGTTDQKNRGGVIGLRAPTTTYSSKVELSNYKYMTFDFDFCADQYRYQYNDVWYTEENLPAEAVAVKDTLTKQLAMGDSGSMRFHPYLNAAESLTNLSTTSSIKAELSNVDAVYTEVSGVWYAYLGDEGNKVALSNEVGVFDHFTYALEYLGDNSFKATLYVNGKYAGSKTTNTVSFTSSHTNPTLVGKKIAFFMMYFSTHTNSSNTSVICNKMYDKYSLAFDNMAINYYAEDSLPYTSLDETLADTTAALYNPNAKDVVYNEDYVTPNPERYVVHNDKKYYVVNAALDKFSDGDAITLANVQVKNFDTVWNEFTVKTEGTGNFTIDYSDSAIYAEKDGKYTKIYEKSTVENGRLPLMASATLFSDRVTMNVYIPKSAGITVTKATGMSVSKSEAVIDDVPYYVVTWGPPVFNFGEREATVIGTYMLEGVETNVTFSVTLDVVKYATLVAQNTTEYPCGSEGAEVVKAMMDYKVAVAECLGKSTAGIEGFYAIYAEGGVHGANCKCEEITAEGDHINVSGAHTGENDNVLPGATFGVQVSGSNFGLVFVIEGAEAEPVVTYVGINGIVANAEVTANVKATSTEGKYFVNVSAANADNEFKITIGENEYVYSLADYIATCTDEATLKLVNAYAKYSLAAENWKVDPAETTEE